MSKKAVAHRFAYELTAEDKAEFLALVQAGYPLDWAAEEIGTTATQIKKHWSGKSEQYFDSEFAAKLRETLDSPEREHNQLEVLRGAQWKAVMEGNTSMIQKMSLVYDPRWEALRHQNFRHDIEVAVRLLPGMTLEELERVRERLLEAGPDVKMLPAVVEAQ